MEIGLTVIVENTSTTRGLLGEHGLACWIRCGARQLLFDTGQGMALLPNAKRLEIPLEKAGAIILSHGHYDHTGGLADVLCADPHASIFAHPDCVHTKYIGAADGMARNVGMPDASRRAMRKCEPNWVKTSHACSVIPGVGVTGPIPRVTDFEDTGGDFFLDPEGRRRDPLDDDQAAYFDTSDGTVVLLGCAHAGVINTLRHIRHLTDNRPIHCVMGGMHLIHASPERLRRTIEELQAFDVQRLGPAHCTGSRAIAVMRHTFPDRVFDFHVGTRLQFTD
jgi:7,8-dihydropterin-6-yl-methyl-4-(beta-D-ribofuranosyl)aminobenzene 5'-phosphate synthase